MEIERQFAPFVTAVVEYEKRVRAIFSDAAPQIMAGLTRAENVWQRSVKQCQFPL